MDCAMSSQCVRWVELSKRGSYVMFPRGGDHRRLLGGGDMGTDRTGEGDSMDIAGSSVRGAVSSLNVRL